MTSVRFILGSIFIIITTTTTTTAVAVRTPMMKL